MTTIPVEGDLGGLSVLKDYGYTSAEEVFYLAQALGPELSELVGVAPIALQQLLGSSLALLPPGEAEELEAMELALGVPINQASPAAIPMMLSPVTSPTAASVNLVPQMPPVRDQGQRGTCVAHATVAVAEHRLGQSGSPSDLSEQFLYWDCKQNDSISDKSGTWLSIAFPLLARDGVCPEAAWNYAPQPCPREDCGPPPNGAIAAALPYRQAVRPVSPNSVGDIKAELESGRCVAFSIPVFRSWFRNVQVRADGKINMPLPNDILEGGHAMCLVGYEESDDPGIGGGRFILRNSWGTAWASHSVYGAGYGSIPFAYIERHCQEAYTVA